MAGKIFTPISTFLQYFNTYNLVNSWLLIQMMIMGNFKKMYVGAIDKEQDAAILYDKVAILTHGLKVIFYH